MIKNLAVNNSEKLKVNKKGIHEIVSLLKKNLKFSVFSLQINIVYSDYLLEINKKYLGHIHNTDIITFNYSGKNDNLDGEIFISIDEALSNSKKYKVTLDNELSRLITHGILHLLGYNDVKPADKRKMKKEENRLVEFIALNFNQKLIIYGY